MKTINQLLPILILFLLASCTKEDSSDVNQDKIYTDYELFYNSNTDKTTVVARFRFGGATGTILELTSPAYVLYNGDTLQYGAIYTGHYKEYAGKLYGGTFTYNNIDNQSFTNNVPANDTLAFPMSLDTVSKSSAYTLAWDGNALSQNESVGLFVGSWTWGQDALYIQNQMGATDLILGTAKMSNVPVGNSTFYMDRTKAQDVAQGTSKGGRIRAKYRAKNKVVYVKN